MPAKHWILNREDPRNLLAISIVVLVIGGILSIAFIHQGAGPRAFAVVWLVGAVGQLVYAVVRFRARRAHAAGDSPDSSASPPAW